MGESIAEYLTRTRAARGLVSQTQFTNSLNHLRQHASWAVWGITTHDLTVFQKPQLWEQLRKDVFIFGGNTGKFRGGHTANFSNFHTPDHKGDERLRKAITGTPLEGAYLSDIVKNHPTRHSEALLEDIHADKVNIRTQVVQPLQQELNLLDAPDPTMLILLGMPGTAKVWDAVTNHPAFPASLTSRFRVVKGVQHHTYAKDLPDQIRKRLDRSFQDLVHGQR